MRSNDGKLSLMLGDEQGSTNVVMPVRTGAGGAMLPASLADASAVTRTSYTPYGVLRGGDNPDVDRGWLGQTEDRIEGTGASSTGTGLTYLNARYYDPVLSRFLSPDPLMNPGDPRTLDPYRYADNNPVVFTDASGLQAIGQYDRADTRVVAKKWDFSPPSVVKAYGRYLWGVLRATTPIPQSVDGIKMDIRFFKDPSGTINAQRAAQSQTWADGVGALKSTWDFTQGKKSWSDHVNTWTHSPWWGYIGNDLDNRNLGGMSERAGVVTGVTIQMVVPGAAAAGAAKGASGLEALAAGAADEALAAGQLRGAASSLRTAGGEPFIDVSGSARILHPEMSAALESIPMEARPLFHGWCAEIGCMNQVLNGGGALEGSTIRTVAIGDTAPGHALSKAPCATCAGVMDWFGVGAS